MTAPESAAQIAEDPLAADDSHAPFTVTYPAHQKAPFVFSSPHSGRHYPASFIEASVLDRTTLRASEDIYVDQLFSMTPMMGAPIIAAEYARAYLDVNREAWELDPKMFSDPMPDYVNVRSGRVTAGLGTIARVVAIGTNIYKDKMPFADAKWRVENVYQPYHHSMEALVNKTIDSFGHSVLIDCHSMPSAGNAFGDMPIRSKGATADFILGDRHGKSCAPELISVAEDVLKSFNYRVVRNDPYSGGYNTRQYGQRDKNQHAMQIEINRSLYVDEKTLAKTDNFDVLQQHMGTLVEALLQISPDAFSAA
jgi:N-formylglutamate amidohydrolase